MDVNEFFHKFFTVCIYEINIPQNFFKSYPLDTLKTRIQAYNKFSDVSHF